MVLWSLDGIVGKLVLVYHTALWNDASFSRWNPLLKEKNSSGISFYTVLKMQTLESSVHHVKMALGSFSHTQQKPQAMRHLYFTRIILQR